MNKYLHSPQLGSSDGQQVMLLNVSAASISLLLTYSLRILNLLSTSSHPNCVPHSWAPQTDNKSCC